LFCSLFTIDDVKRNKKRQKNYTHLIKRKRKKRMENSFCFEEEDYQLDEHENERHDGFLKPRETNNNG